MSVSLPIPAAQIVDVQLQDSHCLDIPCNSLNSVLQALVTEVCSPTFPVLNFQCLTPVTTHASFFQLVIDKLCEVTIEQETPTITYELCQLDSWGCGDSLCIPVDNKCDPDITTEKVVQSLIARVNTYGALISNFCDQIATLQGQVATLQSTVAALQNCCE